MGGDVYAATAEDVVVGGDYGLGGTVVCVEAVAHCCGGLFADYCSCDFVEMRLSEPRASPQATKERRSTIVNQTDPPFPHIVNNLNFLDTNKIKLTEELLQFRIEIAEKCAEEPFACVRSGRNSVQMRRYHFLDSTSLV
ncbi:hypothetical protein ACHAWO_008015 [Cyclotella atomus]|uniref:Uncharacterized protein n=1 Tax=Cyclotella atomus TaxID=382360 RepID=A0ABD3PEG4_9STRA